MAKIGKQKKERDFAGTLVAWQKRHGRHALPWQQTRDAYRIWLSEIMLQQTQVTTVIPYYDRFLARFPDVVTLAASPLESVMAEWSGLGYYSRARNLHRCAQVIAGEYGGVFPSDPVLLEKLPGIGRSTAAAIAVFSSGQRAAILDGNVIRVLSRVFGIAEYAGNARVKERLWQLAASLLPEDNLEAYTQGLMDMGATVCVRANPSCDLCPFPSRCVAFHEGRVKELPVRKPPKALPERQIGMLVLVHGDKVLLQKRPESGIWGGLFSLPEVEGVTSGRAAGGVPAQASAFGKLLSHGLLPGFKHTFTHFHLQIAPAWALLSDVTAKSLQEPYVWYPLGEIGQAPLPSPVKKLLQRLPQMTG